MGRRAKLQGPRTLTVGWGNLGEFCADCPLQTMCARTTVADVLDCHLVKDQIELDRGRRRPALQRHAAYELPFRTIRRAFVEVDAEQVSNRPLPREKGMPWKLAERVEQITREAAGAA